MSKKKNTLKDLDEFLKQQAASLVTPEPVQSTSTPQQSTIPADIKDASQEISSSVIIENLDQLAKKGPSTFRQELYTIIIKTLESQYTSLPEDKMLINTVLYLQSGDQWKEVIRNYWKKKLE